MTEILWPSDRGQILRPWESEEEVPPMVWLGHRGYNPGLTDEQWLQKLNRDYYWYWQLDKHKNRKSPGPSKVAPCAAEHCNALIPIVRDEDGYYKEGSRLCNPCRAKLMERGSMGYLRYTGEPA